MNNQDNLLNLMAILNTLTGYKIEDIINEDNENNNILMSKKMYPNKEIWEELGFRFKDINDDELLCYAELPEGWSIKTTKHPMWNDILDSFGRKRGKMFYKPSYRDRQAEMWLYHRYDIWSDYIDDKHEIKETYFGNPDEKLFIAGQINIPKTLSQEERIEKLKEEHKLEELTRQFADKFYPDWNNVLAYWNNEKDYILTKK